MKLNLRRIATVLASAAMIGSTLGIAAAATYPAPFVAGGEGHVGVILGADGIDYTAGTNLQVDLGDELVAQTAQSGTTTTGTWTCTLGDCAPLKRTSDLFNLGESMSDFYTYLDDDELAIVLADGEYYNYGNEKFEYTQKITLGSGLTLEHFQNDDLKDEPIIGFDLADGTHILNYTLDFTPDNAVGGTSWQDLEQTEITILGKPYFIIEASNSTGNEEIVLLDSANTVTITEGETATLEVGGKSYEIELEYINSDEEVKFKVNGLSTGLITSSNPYEISPDVFVALKTALYRQKTGTLSSAEVSIGEGKIVLKNDEEVEINERDVDGLTAYIVPNSGELDKIILMWELDDDTWITADESITLPGFETTQISMGGFDAAEKETIKVENSNDAMKITVPITDGEETFDFLYLNASATGFAGVGTESGKELLTSSGNTINITDGSKQKFVASWTDGTDVESYILKIDSIDDNDADKNTTAIESVITGSNKGAVMDISDNDDIGRIRFTLDAANEKADTASFTVSAVSTGDVYLDRIFSEEGLKIQLPYDVTIGALSDGMLHNETTADPTTFVMNFTEEDEDNDINEGNSLTVTVGIDSDENEPEVSSVSLNEYETGDNTDVFEGYVASTLATKTVRDTNPELSDVTITYNGEEAYAEVFVQQAGTVLEKGYGGGDGSAASLGNVIVDDTDYSKFKSENLVIIGGSCVNKVAAALLGVEYKTCGDTWATTTGVGAGQFLIKVFENPDASDKIAMLVAGWELTDTQTAVNYLMDRDKAVPTDVGTELKLQTSTLQEIGPTTAV